MSYSYSKSDSQRRAKKKREQHYDKVPIKDMGIDHQILCLHELIAEKCIKNPALFESIVERIELRHSAGQMSYGAYLTWMSIVELKETTEQFKQALLEKSVKMRNMRRATVFTQILTEPERLAVIDAIALASRKDAL